MPHPSLIRPLVAQLILPAVGAQFRPSIARRYPHFSALSLNLANLVIGQTQYVSDLIKQFLQEYFTNQGSLPAPIYDVEPRFNAWLGAVRSRTARLHLSGPPNMNDSERPSRPSARAVPTTESFRPGRSSAFTPPKSMRS